MALPLLASAGLASIPSLFGALTGIGQRRQAKRLREQIVEPNFQQNQGVLQNRDIQAARFGNYQIPGYNQLMNNINSSAGSAFNQGIQGASSSNDVLDLATRIAYGQGQQQRQLGMQNAMGKENALGDFLNANIQAGQERVNANEWDRQKYMNQLAEAAALYQGGGQNIFNSLAGASTIASSAFL